MQNVKQSLLVLNRASNWRDGFVNVVRLATSEPEHNLEGWTEKYGFETAKDGAGTPPGLSPKERRRDETYLGNKKI